MHEHQRAREQPARVSGDEDPSWQFRPLSQEQGSVNRLSELYEPVLFRSLSVANAHVRRHAVILFTDCFPLGSSESRETYSIEEQFKAILVGNRAE